MRLSAEGPWLAQVDGGAPVSHAPTDQVWAILAAVSEPSPQRPSKYTVSLMPVPHTFTVGALGLFTKWSASSMHTLRFPCPAPSPRTAWPSMYAFWLMSSFVFTRALDAPQMREARMNTAEFISEMRRQDLTGLMACCASIN